ncbi:MAG: hypothetical protein KDD43_16385, partial [Bdellovibrionales bacterium]|nr:hypothetical protein [Bdellovibrionales bacterium]
YNKTHVTNLTGQTNISIKDMEVNKSNGDLLIWDQLGEALIQGKVMRPAPALSLLAQGTSIKTHTGFPTLDVIAVEYDSDSNPVLVDRISQSFIEVAAGGKLHTLATFDQVKTVTGQNFFAMTDMTKNAFTNPPALEFADHWNGFLLRLE